MVNFTKTTLQKEGILQDGNVTYNVNVTAINNELTRLFCGITKKAVVQQQDATGGQTSVEENQLIGHIILEYGRQVAEIVQSEDLVPHLENFQGILDEVLGKEAVPEIQTATKTTKK
jgi:hypothetical protein